MTTRKEFAEYMKQYRRGKMSERELYDRLQLAEIKEITDAQIRRQRKVR